jgi:hypothetical protein
MSAVIAWMAAEAEGTGSGDIAPLTSVTHFSQRRREVGHPRETGESHPTLQQAQGRLSRNSGETLRLRSGQAWAIPGEISVQALPTHSFPPRQAEETVPPDDRNDDDPDDEDPDKEQERRVYRGRTVAMLRRYMKYSMETGRLPSLLGKEFFRAKVTAYTVVTFEDRVIFVHDMETCLDRLDEFSRQLIARHILQEHDRCATARLLHCNEKTVRRCTPLVLDQLSEILLEVGLMERLANDEKFLSRGFRP